MTLVTGSPGGGKSVGAAWDLLQFDGSAVVLDPAKHSLAELVLTHSPVEHILFDRLSDPRFALGYGLLRPSRHPDPVTRYEENLAEAEIFAEIMLRQQGLDSLAGAPLKEEWIMAALMLFLTQGDIGGKARRRDGSDRFDVARNALAIGVAPVPLRQRRVHADEGPARAHQDCSGGRPRPDSPPCVGLVSVREGGRVRPENGHPKTFRVACELQHPPPWAGLSVDQAWPILLAFDATCETDWTVAELRRECRDALQPAK